MNQKFPTPPHEEPPFAETGDPRISAWSRLAVVFRRTFSLMPQPEESAPYGFATRVVSQWLAGRREQAMLLWQRWSFRAAAFSVLIALVVIVLDRPFGYHRADEPPLLPYPGLDLPLPTDNPTTSS